MKKYLFVLVFALTAFCFAENKPALSPAQCGYFDTYLSEIVEAYKIPGMAFIITDPNKTVYSGTYGQCQSLEQQFFIGSMSKSYTALSIMQLVEKGLVKLDDDISVYLPEYRFEKKVSVLALLNHTSGFDNHAKYKKARITDSYGEYEYSNSNYDILGKIIEAASGLSYEEYVQKNIFDPLGMADSKADAQKLKNSSKLLTGNRNYFGFFKKGEADYPAENSWFHEPAGFIATTPAEHAKYLRMYLNGGLTEQGSRIISKETIDSMWYENVPLSKDSTAFYGKGWNYMNVDGMKIVFHGGQVENYITYMFILPEKELGICFMINGNDEFGMNSLMDNVFWSSLKIFNGEKPDKVSHVSYFLIHLVLDVIYLLMLSLSLFILLKGIKAKPNKQNNKRRAVKITLNILGFIIWPLFLLTFTKLFIDTPLWVVKSFVPDLYIVILASAAIAFLGGIISAVTFDRQSLHLNKSKESRCGRPSQEDDKAC